MASHLKTHIPDIATWKSSTKGFKSRKSVKINKIDALVAGYHALPNNCSRNTRIGHLQKMKTACQTWIKEQGSRHKKRAPGVEALKVAKEVKGEIY